MLDLRDRKVLVVGGGRIATRKAHALVHEGALVTVIALSITEELREMHNVTVVERAYSTGDALKFQLVITATGDQVVDQQIYDEANAAGIWVNSADDPQRCSFYLAATHRDGNVVIAVSTEGKSPALATHLRNRIAATLPQNLGKAALELSRQRAELHETGVSTESLDWSQRVIDALEPNDQ